MNLMYWCLLHYCDKSRIYIDHMQYLRLFAFLMGLNEVYGHACSQILMMNSLPSVSKAYVMIQSDEGQRIISGMHTDGDVMEPMALYAGERSYGSKSTRSDSTNSESSSFGAKENYSSKKKVNWNLFYEHCKMHGHTRNICYRLVGYLDDWKFEKKPANGEVRGINLRKGKRTANNVQTDKDVDDLGDMHLDKLMKDISLPRTHMIHKIYIEWILFAITCRHWLGNHPTPLISIRRY